VLHSVDDLASLDAQLVAHEEARAAIEDARVSALFALRPRIMQE
jgi:hypothetical protein